MRYIHVFYHIVLGFLEAPEFLTCPNKKLTGEKGEEKNGRVKMGVGLIPGIHRLIPFIS